MKRALLIGTVLVVLGLVIYNRPWEPHISAGAVERHLVAAFPEVAQSAGCHGHYSLDSPKSAGLQLDDWDYTCTVSYRSGDEVTWWVGTDWRHVTETARSGP